jgi:hypothetical protein
LADRHTTLTASGDTHINIMSAWHVDNRDAAELIVRIRLGGVAGQIVVPLSVPAKSSVGNEYEHPLHCDASGSATWYVEIVGANATVSVSGR